MTETTAASVVIVRLTQHVNKPRWHPRLEPAEMPAEPGIAYEK